MKGMPPIVLPVARDRRRVTTPDRDEADPVRVEEFHKLGEVGERSGQSVHLVDHDHIDPVLLDRVQQRLERGTLQTRAGITTVVKATVSQSPSLLRLASDIGGAGLALALSHCPTKNATRLRLVSFRPPRLRRATCSSPRRGRPGAFWLT